MRNELTLIVDSLQNSLMVVKALLPRMLVALLLLIVGWLAARSLQRATVRLLRLFRLDSAAEHTGIDDFLIRGGVRFTVVTLAGQLLYWGVLLIFVVAVFNLLGFRMGPELSARLAGFIPKLVASLAIIVIGSLAARFVRGLAEAYLNNIGVMSTARIGLLLQIALLGFTAILALEQLGMALNLLASSFQLAFGGLCLALALAFGLGGRSWAESILERGRSKR